MIRLGIIGAGTMGRLYAHAYIQHPGTTVSAICDLHEAPARGLADEFGVDAVFTSYQQMLEDTALDAVVVATPDFAHRDPVIACLDAGKHVLCEKPMATTVADCRLMLEAVERSGKQLMVNFGNRHRPASKLLKQRLEAGELGAIEYIYMRLNEKRTKTDTLAWAEQTSPLWFLLSHVTDYVRWLVDAEVRDVYGLGYTGYLKREKGLNTPDTMAFLLKFENGTVASLESSWVLPESFPRNVDLQIEIIGEQGAIHLDFCEGGVHSFTHAATDLSWDWGMPGPTGLETGWWLDSCAYFIHCLETGEHARPDAHDGLAVVAALVAMQESFERGEVVKVQR